MSLVEVVRNGVVLELVRAPGWSKYKYYWRRKRDPSKISKARLGTMIAFSEAAISTRGIKYVPQVDKMKPSCKAVKGAMSKPKRVVTGDIAPINKNVLKIILKDKEQGGLAPTPIIVG